MLVEDRTAAFLDGIVFIMAFMMASVTVAGFRFLLANVVFVVVVAVARVGVVVVVVVLITLGRWMGMRMWLIVVDGMA